MRREKEEENEGEKVRHVLKNGKEDKANFFHGFGSP